MSYPPTNDPAFRSTVKIWIEQNVEVAVLIRFSRAAGSKDFEFFESNESFEERLSQLPPQTSIIVFREKQLPLRGRVSPQFLDQALQLIPSGTEYLIAGLEMVAHGSLNYLPFCGGVNHVELLDDLRSIDGAMIAVGVYPPWLTDSENVVSAIVSEIDGRVVIGVY